MKHFLIAGVLTIALGMLTSQIAQASEARNAKIKAEMVENYLLWEIAYKNKDAERIISFESPDFTWVTQDGRERRTKEEANEECALRWMRFKTCTKCEWISKN